MRKVIILAAFIGVLGSGAVYADGWLCIADAATGFLYKNGKWVSTKFNVDDNKFLVSKGRLDVYKVKEMGEQIGTTRCRDNDPDKEGWLQCKGFTTEWRMNIQSLRYMRSQLIGYVIDDMSKEERLAKLAYPFIEIGRCSPL